MKKVITLNMETVKIMEIDSFSVMLVKEPRFMMPLLSDFCLFDCKLNHES